MIAADPDAVANVHKFWKLFSEGETMIASDCCLIGQSRTTESGQTQVGIMWEYPSTINFGEAIFAIPLIEAYRQLKSCPIADRYATPDGIRQLYQEAKRYEHFAQIEFEAFDQTVPNSLICMGMAILNMNINFDLYHDGSTAQKDRMKDMFVYLQNFFLMTRVRLCNGERYAKIGGISSGSYFTHMIRCITNYFVIQYLHIETSGQKAPFVRAFGSESIVASHKRIDSNRWMTLAEKIGMKINPDRSFISSQLTDLTFLGYPVKA